MRRRLAFAAVLALAAPSARAEPLDLDLAQLGAPDPAVWTAVISAGGAPAADADALARESRQRFAILSSEMALALSSAILHPASTIGHSRFAFDLEVATMAIHPDAVGAAPPIGSSGVPLASNSPWPTASTAPDQLYVPSLHVRKALPFSFELGGRVMYLSQSSYFAAQGEAKWAINEGFERFPDVAVRVAYTRLFGQTDWSLGTTDLDLMVSKRWSLGGATSLTPYLAGRLTWVYASSDRIEFMPGRLATDPSDPATLATTQGEFPRFSAVFYRTTLGVRFTASVFSLALEGTYFDGSEPSDGDYDGVKVASSFGGAAKLGWEF
jgi:hypothetical protein